MYFLLLANITSTFNLSSLIIFSIRLGQFTLSHERRLKYRKRYSFVETKEGINGDNVEIGFIEKGIATLFCRRERP